MATLKRLYFVAMILLIYGLAPRPSWAGSKLLNVQGKLTDSSGNPLTGAQTVIFRLYTSSTAPVANAVWTESQGVTPQSGLFSVTLGNVTTLNSLVFNQPYYLGMQVAGDPNELSPRQLLGASAYALGSLSDFSVGQNLIVSSNAVVSGSVTSNGIVGTQTNDSAAIGNVGEYVATNNPGGITMSNGNFGVVGAIILSPGDWDVTGVVEFISSGLCTAAVADIVPITGVDWGYEIPGQNSIEVQPPNINNYGTVSTAVIPNLRVSLSASETLYLKAFMYFSGSGFARGSISARRIR